MTDTSNLQAGTAHVTINGMSIFVSADFEYGVSKVERETLKGMDGIHGYKEKPVPGFISCQVRDARGSSVSDFSNQTNVTVIAELANGKTIIGSNMWTVETQEVKSEDAVFTVKWEGRDVKEY